MDDLTKKDLELLSRMTSRKMTRRALLKQLAGLAALGVIAPACQNATSTPTPQPAAPKATSTTAAAAPKAATAVAPAASPTAKSVSLLTRRPLKCNWTAVSGAMSGVWMAHEIGAWKELGLDSELIHIASSSRVVAAFQTKEIDASPYDWVVAFTAAAAGVPSKIVAGITNRTIFSMISVKAITKPADVKGKRFGITRLGSSTHTAALLALDTWGMKPTDVNFIELQEVPAVLAAMQAGQVDVGSVSPPTNARAVQAGFNELINLGNDGPEYPSVALAVNNDFFTNSRDATLAVVAGYANAVKRFRSDPERAMQVIKKYLEIDDQATLADTQKQFSRYLPYPPVVPLKSAEKVRDDSIQMEPKVANVTVDQVATNQVIEELDKMGYFA